MGKGNDLNSLKPKGNYIYTLL